MRFGADDDGLGLNNDNDDDTGGNFFFFLKLGSSRLSKSVQNLPIFNVTSMANLANNPDPDISADEAKRRRTRPKTRMATPKTM